MVQSEVLLVYFVEVLIVYLDLIMSRSPVKELEDTIGCYKWASVALIDPS